MNQPDLKTFEKLCKVVIADILVFCRRRPGEVCLSNLQQYSLRTNDDGQSSTDEILNMEEKKAGQNLLVFFVPGKNDKQVPILLTQHMEAGIQCLIHSRSALQVPSGEKDLIFSKKTEGNDWVAFDGSNVLSEFVKKVPLKKPADMTCTGLRHHIATDTQLHHHDAAYTNNLADFMGHTLKVHLKNYKLPISVIFRSQIGARLMKFR